ncbi:MAG TPA: cyclase family protein [Chloroflexi bacterium]|nr:MAG: cyclase family protein [Chloroflexota bacterium]HDD56041.1 cyclase family protein [Chloroflexota bacterium]
MNLFDISLTITEDLPTWPGDPGIKLEKTSQIKEGEMANLTHISTSVHVGTHVDAPDHFLGNGETVEKIPLDLLVGPALVVELSSNQTISADDLRSAGITGKDQRLLLKTRNSRIWAEGLREFQEDFIALDAGAASYLVECGLKVVGVDYLSVAPFTDPEPTHRILLEAGVLIIEGLDLSGIKPGPYRLLCLPLKIGGSDGAPARVLLQGD